MDALKVGLSILVIEDDRDSADSYAFLLKLSGHRVRVATDGEMGVRLAADESPDVVLLDIGLPGMDGYAVAQRLRDQPGLRRPFLVAITGYSRNVDRCHAEEAGIDLHITKPADPVELLSLLRRFEQVIRPGAARTTEAEKTDDALPFSLAVAAN